MKKQYRQFYFALLCTLFIMTSLVYAAESRSPITHIPLTLETVSAVRWVGDHGIGRWEEHKDAKYYQVRLFRGNTSVMSAKTSYDSDYDFSSYLTRSGDYSFQVRAADQSEMVFL